MRFVLLGLAAAISLATLFAPVSAQVFVDERSLVVDPAEAALDSLPPGVPQISLRSIVRGKSTPESERLEACTAWLWQRGSIVLDVSPPTDDRTRDLDLGYVFELVSGEVPNGMALPTYPVRSAWDRWLVVYDLGFVAPVVLHWMDGDEDPQDPFRCEIRVAAVDRAGNVGEWSEAVVVGDGVKE
ncbi:MAG: hypothetical protein R3E97_08575 [Candidatus Eisenbacteria bacterium]